jgi:hypothetical protein
MNIGWKLKWYVLRSDCRADLLRCKSENAKMKLLQGPKNLTAVLMSHQHQLPFSLTEYTNSVKYGHNVFHSCIRQCGAAYTTASLACLFCPWETKQRRAGVTYLRVSWTTLHHELYVHQTPACAICPCPFMCRDVEYLETFTLPCWRA